LLQRIDSQEIPAAILIDLPAPEFLAASWPFEQVAVMPVPETAVGEDHCLMLWKYEVGLARQVPYMESKAKAAPVQAGSQDQLRLRILAPDAGHHPAAHFGRYDVSHWRPLAHPV
jgi:hypothetical protein